MTFSNYDLWKKKAFSIILTFQVFAGKVDFPHGWVAVKDKNINIFF